MIKENLVVEDTYSYYNYEIWDLGANDYMDIKYYYYKILDIGGDQHYWLDDPVIRESSEYYDTLDDAVVAAKDSIDRLESGE